MFYVNTSSKSAHFWDPKMFTAVTERGYKWGCYYYYDNNYIKTYLYVFFKNARIGNAHI